jgi:hypothetical protein
LTSGREENKMKITIVSSDPQASYRDMLSQEIDVHTIEEFRDILKVFAVENVKSNPNFGITIMVHNILKNWPIEGNVMSMLDGKMFNIKSEWPRMVAYEI